MTETISEVTLPYFISYDPCSETEGTNAKALLIFLK
jgi:hypothetical protein